MSCLPLGRAFAWLIVAISSSLAPIEARDYRPHRKLRIISIVGSVGSLWPLEPRPEFLETTRLKRTPITRVAAYTSVGRPRKRTHSAIPAIPAIPAMLTNWPDAALRKTDAELGVCFWPDLGWWSVFVSPLASSCLAIGQ